MITISGLFVYPVKSCRGISLDEVEIGTRGFLHDREFLVVDETDRFVTQRTLAELARVEISLGETGFKMCAPNVGELHLPYAQQTDGRTRTVTIFNDTVVADDAGDEAAEWFSSALAQRCRLVRIGAAYSRTVRPDNIRDEHRSAVVAPAVSFTDAFPTLITSEESLANLNTRLPSPVPMNRFRPNIVVRGSGAYDENAWSTVRAGDMLFRAATACLRCTITTIDQELARQTGAEPLRTLATYRRSPAREGVMFGEYLIHDRPGKLHVGQTIFAETRN